MDPTRRSLDPLFPQTFNRYSYSRNNPINRLDPDGEADIPSEVASNVFGFLPFAGEFQDATIALTGYDPITSEKQSGFTRWSAAGAFLIPLAGGKTISRGLEAVGNGFRRMGARVMQGLANYAVTKGLRSVEAGASLSGKVSNGKLARTLGELFRASDQVAGGTAGAIRYEKRTGELVGRRSHIRKGEERVTRLQNILENEELSTYDRTVAENVLQDLQNALAGK